MTEAAQSSPEDPFIGRVLNERYRIEGPLGEGGIGRVYRARHLTVGNHVALKVLQAQYENLQVLRDRFSREVEALARLKHPNIVTVQDYGVDNDVPYLVMELLDGTDLSRLIAKDVIEPRRVLDIFKQILRALAYAHEQGLVHRDLKPQNVFVRPVGGGAEHVEVLDFGLARFMDDEQKGRAKLTRTGALIGTPAYM
ncbi:MAG: serine/threonine protein kinase, partial [Sandaracinaceae bacterium]|nr:serine/threonine protein kinase [Sandaracinaceae bacterium]